METTTLPKTLVEALDYFRSHENCHNFLVSIRWPHGVRCPHCGSPVVRYMESVRRWKCYEKHPQPQFSLKTGTIFEESPITLRKWLAAVWMIVNCKNGISSYEIHREIGVTQKTAWFMGHRIRTAIHEGTFERMLDDDGEEVEVDETFIGGKARNMHADVKARRITGRGPNDKTAALGMLERGGVVTTKVVCNRRRKRTLQKEVHSTVAAGAALYSDGLASYDGLDRHYAHETVNHAIEYVRATSVDERAGELLEPVEADAQRHLRQRGALPPAPLPRRAGISVQPAEADERRAVPQRRCRNLREAPDLRRAARPGAAERTEAGIRIARPGVP